MLRDTSSLALKPVIPLLLVNDQVSAPCQFFFFLFLQQLLKCRVALQAEGGPSSQILHFPLSSPPHPVPVTQRVQTLGITANIKDHSGLISS